MSTIISDTTLDRFEETLPDKQFYRVHRGFIVNVGRISRLYIESKRYVVSFSEVESNVPVSRAKVAELKNLLG
jgi:DNA-binding LytR/AlgR family response regulator